MKTIMIERNFHIMNEDRFIMEKISIAREVNDEVNEQDIINSSRETIVTNFKAAYPHLKTYLNFDEVVQVNKGLADFDKRINQNHVVIPTDHEFYSRNDSLNLPTTIPEKINKGTIEEQIEACKTVDELASFRIIVNMNKKLMQLYDIKLHSLTYPTKLAK